jgi:hypothetical protein
MRTGHHSAGNTAKYSKLSAWLPVVGLCRMRHVNGIYG